MMMLILCVHVAGIQTTITGNIHIYICISYTEREKEKEKEREKENTMDVFRNKGHNYMKKTAYQTI